MIKKISQFARIKIAKTLNIIPKDLPVLLIWITNNCNLRCKMCGDRWRSGLSNPKKILRLDDWFQVIDNAKKLRTRIISITGGEPFLNPDFFSILHHIKEAGIACHICTNGTLLTNENIKKLASTNISSVSISLDSNQRQIHNYLRSSDCFDKTISGIMRLRKTMPELMININFTINHINLSQMSLMPALGKKLKVNKMSFAPVHSNLQHKYKPQKELKDLLLTQKDLPLLRKELKTLQNNAKNLGIRISSKQFLNGISDYFTYQNVRPDCFAGYASCAISPWGEVSPCSDMDSNLSLFNQPLDKIWLSKDFHELRKKVKTCKKNCWDTTNAELGLRFQFKYLFKEINQVINDIVVY